MRYFVTAFIVFMVDQFSKWLVVRNMELGQSIPLIEGIFHLTSHRNAGAAFGILQGQRLFFIVLTTVVVLGVIYYLYKIKDQKSVLAWSLAFILGGALGNYVDRLVAGEVVDFFDIYIGAGSFVYNFPIFNVADAALCFGVGLLFIDTVRESIREKKARKFPAE